MKASRSTIGICAAAVLALVAGIAFYRVTSLSRLRARTYRIGINYNPPYQYFQADGSIGGAAVEVLTEAARRARVRLDWRIHNEGPDDALRAKSVDLWPIAADLPARRTYIYFSEPWMEQSYDLLAAKPWTGEIGGLAGWRIAAFDLGLNLRIARERAPQGTIVKFRSRPDSIAAVCTGAADAVLIESRFADAAVVNPPAACEGSHLYALRMPDSQLQFGVASTFEARRVADLLHGEILRMAEDGTLALIFSRSPAYGLQQAQFTFERSEARRRARTLQWLAGGLAAGMVLAVWLLLRNRALQKEADRANRAKSEFLANMSHE
ncbi:MAG TPA: hypothetical protein DEH78_30085, partial [Solibacterales bacterium]|nr:hypothetical protein [Bryobacterales bacterium]